VLVVVCGLPGAGKTTVSEAIADRLDAPRLRTDVVRKDLLEAPDYTREESRRVYEELLTRGETALDTAGGVVLDGTFKREPQRDAAAALAASREVSFQLVKVECEPAVVRDRIAAREGDESDADFEIHELHREQFEPLDRDHTVVDNSNTLAETHRQVDAMF
jgi:predicted kinase